MANKLKKALAVLLCAVLAAVCFPISTQAYERPVTPLYDDNEMMQKFLTPDGGQKEKYPNGCFILPMGSAQLEMEGLYAVDIYRQGGTNGKSEVTLTVYDLYAQYGVDYRLYTDRGCTKPLDGTPAPLYSASEFSFIPVVTQTNSEYYDVQNAGGNGEIENFQKQMMETAPKAAQMKLTFASGEASKRLYIETLQNETVTDDKQFNLVLSEPSSGELGVQTTASYTIKETREKPQAQLSISNSSVNPKSDKAYVTVSRTGNLGKTVHFVFMTQSKTAQAQKDYEATQLELMMLPTMRELKVPVSMLPGARDGRQFEVILRNVQNAKAEKSSASVTISGKTAVEEEAVGEEDDEFPVREYVKADVVNGFSHTYVATGTATLDELSHGFDPQTDEYINFKAYRKSVIGSDAVVIKSTKTYNFTGIDSMQLCVTPEAGSTVEDYISLYAGTSPHIDETTTDLAPWREYVNQNGGRWSISSIQERQTFKTGTVNLKGEQNLYLALDTSHSGWCGAKVYESSQYGDLNLLLHKTKYTMKLLDPDKIEVLDGDQTAFAVPASNMRLTDPGATKDDVISTGSTTDIYRDETTTLMYTKNDTFGTIKFEGVKFINPETKAESELYPCASTSLTLTPEVLETYADYISGAQIQIKPVFRSEKVTLAVQSYDNTATSGEKFLADNKNCTGTYYVYGTKAATVSWTVKEGDYNLGDTVSFQTAATGKMIEGGVYSLAFYRTINCESEDAAPSAQYAEIHPAAGTTKMDFSLNDFYNSVTPVFTTDQAKVMLQAVNPELGDFSGKDTAKDENGRMWVDLTGQAENAPYLTLTAAPKSEGYRCKWQYRNSATYEIETYYGSVFYYEKQNPVNEDDNYITLTFEKTEQARSADVYISGHVYKQRGSILSPPSYDSNEYDPAQNAAVVIGAQEGTSDRSGKFFLQQISYVEDPDNLLYDENGNPVYGDDGKPVHAKKEVVDSVKTAVCSDERYRALVVYQNSQYIVDIDMRDYITNATTDGETIQIDVKLPYQNRGVKPVTITATDTQGNEYVNSVPLVSLETISFSLYIDASEELPDAPVNMVRWTIESEGSVYKTPGGEVQDQGSVVMSVDLDMEEGSSVSVMQQMLSEIAAPGDRLYVEIMSKTYDEDGNTQYTSYGRYDTGYSFTSQSEELSVTYCPDLGVPSGYCVPAPVIGIITPTFSLKGFSPVYNIGPGPKYDGNQTYTITIGLNFAVGNDLLNKGGGWNTTTLKDNTNKMMETVKGWGSNIKNSKDLMGNSSNGVLKAMNLKTSIKCSLTATVMFQSYYYFDPDDNGMVKVCGSLLIAGGGFSIRFEWPFMLFKIPCFVYLTAGIEMDIYMGIFPVTEDSSGNRIALTLDQLDRQELSYFQGVYEGKVSLGVGGGIGFSGLINVQGGLNSVIDMQFNDFGEGIGSFKMMGTITVQLCMLKYTWNSPTFVNVPLFDTVNGLHAQPAAKNVQQAFDKDILRDVRFKDLKLASSPALPQSAAQEIKSSKDAAIKSSGYGMLSPSVAPLGDGRYFIAFTNDVSGVNEYNPQGLYYAIYDENKPEQFEIRSLLQDAYDYAQEQGKDIFRPTKYALSTIDMDAQTIDTGDDIMIVWTKANSIYNKDTQALEMLRSIGIASVLYNKAGGYFHSYTYLKPQEKAQAYVQPKAVYDKESGLVQIFYQRLDTSSLNGDSTLEDFQNLPTSFETRAAVLKDSKLDSWSDGQLISLNEKYVKYYDAVSVNGKNALAFVGADSPGFTMDEVSPEEYDAESGVNPEEFSATKNAMYLKLYSLDGTGTLTATNNILLSDKDDVTAKPSFAEINASVKGADVHNLLLFYRQNGSYVYQNITDLLLNGTYTDSSGNLQVTKDYLCPQRMTAETDRTINDDFKIISDHTGSIYALFTVSEYDQQQIWASSFYATDVLTQTQRAVLDNGGNRQFDVQGRLITESIKHPVTLLTGTWGAKTYLTKDSVNGSGYGKFKKAFDGTVLSDGDILAVYNAFDYDLSSENAQQKNNMIVVGKLDTSPVYTFDKAGMDTQLDVSSQTPMPNHVVTVKTKLLNTGVRTGRNIDAVLYAGGQPVDQCTIAMLPAGSEETVTFSYLVPESILDGDITLEVKASDGTNAAAQSEPFVLKHDMQLSIKTLRYIPINYVTAQKPNSKYLVYAYVKNEGNKNYENGAYISFLLKDMEEAVKTAQKDYRAGKPIYTVYGTAPIKPLRAGEASIVKFTTCEIPPEAFKMGGGKTAYFETIISDSSITKKKEIDADDPIVIADSYFPGLTVKNMAPKPKELAAGDISLTVGQKQPLTVVTAPLGASLYQDFSYRSSDPSVIQVDKSGIVTALKQGSAVITVKCGDIAAQAVVTAAPNTLGDLNGDGRVNVADVLLMQKSIARMTRLTDRQLAAADINGDGHVMVADVLLVQQYIAKIIGSLEGAPRKGVLI